MTYTAKEATQMVMADMPDRAVIYADLTQVTLAGRVLANEVNRLREALLEAAEMTEHETDRTLIYNYCKNAAEDDS